MKRRRQQPGRECKRRRHVEEQQTEDAVPWDLLVTDIQHVIVRQHCTPLARVAMSLTCKQHYRDYELASTTDPCSLLALHLEDIDYRTWDAYLCWYTHGFRERPSRAGAMVLVYWSCHLGSSVMQQWLPAKLPYVVLADLVAWPMPILDRFLQPYLDPMNSFAGRDKDDHRIRTEYSAGLVRALRHSCFWLLRWFDTHFETLREYMFLDDLTHALELTEWPFPWSDRPEEMTLLANFALRLGCGDYLPRHFMLMRLLPAASRVHDEESDRKEDDQLQRDWALHLDIISDMRLWCIIPEWELTCKDRHWLTPLMLHSSPAARQWAMQWLRRRVTITCTAKNMTKLFAHYEFRGHYSTVEALTFFWTEILNRPSMAAVEISLEEWLGRYISYDSDDDALMCQPSVLPDALPMLEWFLHPDRHVRLDGSIIRFARKCADFRLLHYILCERAYPIEYHLGGTKGEQEKRFASNFRAWVAAQKK